MQMPGPLAATLAAATLVAVTLASPLAAQQLPGDTSTHFHWTGHVRTGGWLRVHNLSGEIRVESAGDGPLDITTDKRGDREDLARIRIVVLRDGTDGDVTVCALWSERDSCGERESHYHSHHDRDDGDDEPQVRFTIRLPVGLNVAASTVNGKVAIDGATSAVEASTVNGGVDASTTGGPVTASTVNGDVSVRMSSTGTAGHLDYSTVNGSVSITLPAKLDADVDLSTVNGRLDSDYPITMQGHIDPRQLRGTIGAGGLKIQASTVNGSINLRRS